jgi:MFS family permease
MIPGMAIITSAASPQLRGTFMTLNSSVQSAGMGVAAFIGGLIISRDANGLVQHYWGNALLGVCASTASIALVGKLFLYGAPGAPVSAPVSTPDAEPVTK